MEDIYFFIVSHISTVLEIFLQGITTMQLTKQTLKDLINQVYIEAFQDLTDDEPDLLAEPIANELPPSQSASDDVICEGDEGTINKLIQALNHLDADQRKRIFHRFGHYSGQHLLAQLNNIKKAEKGDL